MEKMPIKVGSHHDYLCKRCESMRCTGKWLDEIAQAVRMSIWLSGGRSEPVDLIPGLPDQLVENEIWPQLRNYVEDVQESPDSMPSIPSLKKKIHCLTALSLTNRKWRHLVEHSKPWAGVSLVNYRFPHLYLYQDVAKCKYFEYYMRILPPLDTYSNQSRTFLRDWYKEWRNFDKEERDFMLQLYLDRQDRLGRLSMWKEKRDLLKKNHRRVKFYLHL